MPRSDLLLASNRTGGHSEIQQEDRQLTDTSMEYRCSTASILAHYTTEHLGIGWSTDHINGHTYTRPMNWVITPRACAKGKAISLCICHCPHENRQLGRSRHLSGSKASRSSGIREKLASMCLELFRMVYKHHKQRLLVGHCSHTHRPCSL